VWESASSASCSAASAWCTGASSPTAARSASARSSSARARGVELLPPLGAGGRERAHALELAAGARGLDVRRARVGLGGRRRGGGLRDAVACGLEIGTGPRHAGREVGRVEAHEELARGDARVLVDGDLEHAAGHLRGEVAHRAFDEGVVGALDVAQRDAARESKHRERQHAERSEPAQAQRRAREAVAEGSQSGAHRSSPERQGAGAGAGAVGAAASMPRRKSETKVSTTSSVE
jgi:hypothetical protein